MHQEKVYAVDWPLLHKVGRLNQNDVTPYISVSIIEYR
jgi:hypothetical protein